MTLLTVVRDVCAVVGVAAPTSVFTNITANRTMQEMLALANEMAQRIAYNTRDWTKLKTSVTYTGDGIQTAFNLPANYQRMLLTSNVWRSTSSLSPMMFVPDYDEWLNRRTRGFNEGGGEWTMAGGQILIEPPLGVDETAYFTYVDKNCVALASGGRGDIFMNDADTFVLPERVLKLGMTFQWKAQKGSPYNEDLGTYEDALAYASGHDSPAPIIIGRKAVSVAARIAYPWPVPS